MALVLLLGCKPTRVEIVKPEPTLEQQMQAAYAEGYRKQQAIGEIERQRDEAEYQHRQELLKLEMERLRREQDAAMDRSLREAGLR
jgi:hypothetical protein